MPRANLSSLAIARKTQYREFKKNKKNNMYATLTNIFITKNMIPHGVKLGVI